MTEEQKRAAWACMNRATLREWLIKYCLRQPKLKGGMAQALANSDVEIPDEIYELWKGNRGRSSNVAVPKRDKNLEPVHAKKEDVAKWILENVNVQKDPIFEEYMTILREKVNNCLQGRHKNSVNLHPPGFEKGEFPCLMHKGYQAQRFYLTLNGDSTLETEISTRLGRPVRAQVESMFIEAQMLVNGELDRLKQLGAFGGNCETSHLCHSKWVSSRA